jgi:carboxyl-terminal processing protease
MRRQLAATDGLAVRERFFEVLIEAFDPHSGYFSADSAREFEVEMAGSVAGVGLELCKDDGFCVVATITPGGPADLQGEIRAGDRIEGVAEGDGALAPASGKRLREIVTTVRGRPGTKVRIQFRPPAAEAPREVTLERTQVVLPWERARGAICTTPDAEGRSRRIGCIHLPAFYAAGEKGSVASATSDMRELLVQMKAAGMEGLVLDIRDNPGGALDEAVSASGLFLPEGTVLLTRELDGKVKEHKVESQAAIYGGPLVVLTSSGSASASEIFAEAVKYHQRAVLAGAATTFGKGTVQSYIDLAKAPARAGATAAEWGVLRLTTERFYGPCGEGIQRIGAKSDIVVPEFEDKAEKHEAGLPHAFPAEAIEPPKPAAIAAGDFARVNEDLLLSLRAVMEKDQAVLPECLLWKKEIALWAELATPKERSLQLAKRRKDRADETALREALRRERRSLLDAAAFPNEPVEIAAVRSVLAASESRMRQPLPDGTPRSGHLHGGTYCGELPGGRPSEIRLDAIDFRRFSGDVGPLAKAFSAGCGRPTDDATIAGILVELSLIEKRTDDAVFARFARNLGGPPVDRAALGRGIDAFLRGLTGIDSDLLRERPALDVPLRESLRLAAAWAARAPSPPAVSRAAAATTALSPNPADSP